MLQTRYLIWALLFFGYAASLQVEITPMQGEISMGESKFFLCEVVGDVKDIDWYAPNGEKLLPNRQDILVNRNDESSSTLTIYNANVDNAGIYKCVAKNGDKESQGTVNVKIFQKITFKNAPSPQEFNEGDDADIICDVVSSPPADIIWKHKGSKIQVAKDVRFKILTNNHLQIRGIKKTDEGAYTCEARVMTRGEIDLKIIKVIINVLPSIRTRQSEVNATADINQSVMLACDADGFPEPTVTWARKSIVLESDDKYGLNDDGSELIIKDVKKVDEGDYTCIARNKAGEKEEEVSLNVFMQPKITYLVNQTASELEEQITLTCEASGDPTPTITWSFGSRVFTEREQASWTRPETYESLDGNVVVRSHARVSSLTLKYVQYTDGGHYLCTARNSIGQDQQTMYLEVRYAPKIQGSVAVYTWEGNAANISCEVLAHPGASVVWFRDGQQQPSTNTTNVKIYNTPAVSYLEVTPDSQNDFGSYNCTATNMIGTESKEFLLIQADVPSAPAIERVEPFSSTAVVEFEEPDASGGVAILKYRAEWRMQGEDWAGREYDAEDGLSMITIVGLKPETIYEVKMSAINGKGEGESSPPLNFKTEPVLSSVTPTFIPSTSAALKGEPSPPKLEGKLQTTGNTLKVNWIKQDDGGSPIKHYLIRYRAKHVPDWKPEIRLPHGSEYVVLSSLDWNTEYEVYVVAENQQGKSQPGTLSFRTAAEPTAIPDTMDSGSGLGTGAIVGILIVVFVLLLVGIDVTCYFLNKCGLVMCIAVNFCGKSGPGAKSKDLEEGKAAFTKDESKGPIVEVRTEEERTPNHEGGGPTEPNETTPLTEPEPAGDTTATVVDLLPSVATNSDPITESFSTCQNSPASESTTLTSSTAGPTPVSAESKTNHKTSPKSTPAPIPQSSTPKASTPTPQPATQSNVAPLVDLSEAPKATPLSNPKPPTPSAPSSEPAKVPSNPPSAKADAAPQSQHESVQSPSASDSQNKDLQIDGLAKDVFDAPGKGSEAPADSTAAPAPAQDDGKIVTDDKSKVPETVTEVKKTLSEVKTVPNEAAKTNGNESKA
ncbi:neural cell adhesion molecule 1-like isoform X3 [Coregonus clupeaformis]|uniref:neural cell adhesion molecule 1-like isoform X3 n=1 Tax=Coregonus clupeaformis TaxID=59861 RepID=UPI001E1C9445|nr:neural cell adhesion molecule 1-like isoform X3 [Coregonus clupeaformis]